MQYKVILFPSSRKKAKGILIITTYDGDRQVLSKQTMDVDKSSTLAFFNLPDDVGYMYDTNLLKKFDVILKYTYKDKEQILRPVPEITC